MLDTVHHSSVAFGLWRIRLGVHHEGAGCGRATGPLGAHACASWLWFLFCAGMEVVQEWESARPTAEKPAPSVTLGLCTATGPSWCLPPLLSGSRSKEDTQAKEFLLGMLNSEEGAGEAGEGRVARGSARTEEQETLVAQAYRICADAGVCASLDWARAVPEGLREIEHTLGIEAARAALVQVRGTGVPPLEMRLP